MRKLLLEYGQWVLSQADAEFCTGTLQKEAAGLPASYLQQDAGCLLAWLKNEPPALWPGTRGHVLGRIPLKQL